jgi:tetratricopeptide (TPR) repeat protein
MLAYHYSKSGNAAKAYAYLKKSAEKAVRNDAVVEAVRFYRGAMEVLCQLPPSVENEREQIGLVLSMQIPWRRIGYSQDYLPLLQKAEALTEALGDDKNRVRVRSVLGLYYILKGGDPQLGWKYLDSCMDYPEIIQDVDIMVPVGVDLCFSCFLSGDFQRINNIAPAIINLIEYSGKQAEFFGRHLSPYSYVHGLYGASTGICGDFDYGGRLLEKALSFARQLDHLASIGNAELVYGATLATKGDGRNAAGYLQNAIKDLEESQTMVLLGIGWTWLGYAHCLMGQSKTAVDLTEKGLKMHTDLGIPFWRSLCHWLCSVVYFELDGMGQARTHAELALQFSMENNERQMQGLSRTWLGRIISKADATQIDLAEQNILQGIGLLEELGIRGQSCFGFLWLGEVYAESDRQKEAQVNLKKAEGMFQDMGMDYWLGKTREVLKRIG